MGEETALGLQKFSIGGTKRGAAEREAGWDRASMVRSPSSIPGVTGSQTWAVRVECKMK